MSPAPPNPCPQRQPCLMRQIKRFRLIGLALGFSLAIAMWQHPLSAHADAQPLSAHADAQPTEPSGAQVAWQPPLSAPLVLVTPYFQPTSDYSAGHRGVDYRVNLSQPVFAPTAAQVWFAGKVVDRSVLSLRTSDGQLLEFEPACTDLRAGTWVKAGQPVASICDADPSYSQHCLMARCMHYSLRTSEGYLSPLIRTAELTPSVLLPRTGFSF